MSETKEWLSPGDDDDDDDAASPPFAGLRLAPGVRAVAAKRVWFGLLHQFARARRAANLWFGAMDGGAPNTEAVALMTCAELCTTLDGSTGRHWLHVRKTIADCELAGVDLLPHLASADTLRSFFADDLDCALSRCVAERLRDKILSAAVARNLTLADAGTSTGKQMDRPLFGRGLVPHCVDLKQKPGTTDQSHELGFRKTAISVRF